MKSTNSKGSSDYSEILTLVSTDKTFNILNISLDEVENEILNLDKILGSGTNQKSGMDEALKLVESIKQKAAVQDGEEEKTVVVEEEKNTTTSTKERI